MILFSSLHFSSSSNPAFIVVPQLQDSSHQLHYPNPEVKRVAGIMSRFSRYDSDEERLPEGMTRVGYDADDQVYTFQDADGSLWESAPGCQYGQLTRVGQAAAPIHDDDTQPFLVSEQYEKPSWRAEMMPLLNFGMLIGLSLIGLFWYLHVATQPSHDDESVPQLSCSGNDRPYTIQKGDSCWDLAEYRGITVDDMVAANDGLDCEKLLVGSEICLPELTTSI